MECKVKILGPPIAKHRPRFARRGKYVVTYSDQETEEGLWILEAKRQIQQQGGGKQTLFSGPVKVDVTCYLRRPKHHYRTGRRSGELKEGAPAVPVTTPDGDNYLKFALDCLNHCGVWPDDSYVSDVRVRKRYANYPEEARTEIRISLDGEGASR
ncbi:MAG: RusA family crossover junction endodeoxyribonuclease [Chloroflexota bacterium]